MAFEVAYIPTFRSVAAQPCNRGLLSADTAGSGGSIEVRLDQPDGPLLASTEIVVNGEWEKFYDREVELAPTSGRHDVIIRFTHPNQAGGLMNLDSIVFQK